MKPNTTLALDVLECNNVAIVYIKKHICCKPNSSVFTSVPLIETDKQLTNTVITTRIIYVYEGLLQSQPMPTLAQAPWDQFHPGMGIDNHIVMQMTSACHQRKEP